MTASAASPDASPGPPKEGKRDRTRRALVAAAGEVIAEKGFDRASLDEICARAGMSRGAFHGNFASRQALLQAVMEAQWSPVEADFRPGASLREQMRILGKAVADHARARRPAAAVAAALQLQLLTNEPLRREAAERTAEGWRSMAVGLGRILPPGALPMPAERFVRVLDALTTGLLFTYFQAPELLEEADFIAAFEALAGPASAPPTRAWSTSGVAVTPARRW